MATFDKSQRQRLTELEQTLEEAKQNISQVEADTDSTARQIEANLKQQQGHSLQTA